MTPAANRKTPRASPSKAPPGKGGWKRYDREGVSHSIAHYLTAIHDLKEAKGYARVSDVARELDVTKASVSLQMKHLKTKGFVREDENRFLSLSETGEGVAHALEHSRDVIVRFLRGVLGVSDAQADVDACKIEHLLSPETTERIWLVVQLLDAR
jgi:DtxR family Mn-dependent transcriptional regulator